MLSSISVILDDLVRIHSQGEMLLLPIADIVTIRSNENYTHVYIADGRMFTIRLPLKCWEQQLPAKAFIRTHRTTLINLARVTGHRRLSPKKWIITLRDYTDAVPIGRLYWSKLKPLLAAASKDTALASHEVALSA